MSSQYNMRIFQVLLVEDNPADARLVREGLKEGKLFIDLKVAEDGVEALAFLRKEGRYANEQTPNLILLDLNLPKKNGREVLAELKADEALRHIPVVVLTTSEDEKDIHKSYHLHANSYIVKPVDFEQFIRVIQSLEDYWFTIARLPKEE
ncbi:MAG: response regulator [Candidatus Hodarchaeales archaeon]|jgi:CheY-like chemotaxis protein